MNAKVVLITPEKAQELLKRNTDNRPLRYKTVLFYAEEMKRGNWRLTGQGISISQSGRILDGQHRLEAIIKSGCPISMLLIEGVADDTFSTYDTGKNRSYSDIFSIAGIKNSTQVSSTISNYYKWKMNFSSVMDSRVEGSVSLSKKMALNIYYENPEFFQEVTLKAIALVAKTKLLSQAYLGGFMSYLILEKKHNSEKVFSFAEQVMTGRDIENNTINLFRDVLIRDLSERYKMTEKMKHTLLITTWNRYVTGVELKQLKYYADKEIEQII